MARRFSRWGKWRVVMNSPSVRLPSPLLRVLPLLTDALANSVSAKAWACVVVRQLGPTGAKLR
jgi:hypothetical protein